MNKPLTLAAVISILAAAPALPAWAGDQPAPPKDATATAAAATTATTATATTTPQTTETPTKASHELGDAGFGKADDGRKLTPLETYLAPEKDDRAPAGESGLSPRMERDLETAGAKIDKAKLHD
jgi:hypothetical protein